jgi:hypothetical protein
VNTFRKTLQICYQKNAALEKANYIFPVKKKMQIWKTHKTKYRVGGGGELDTSGKLQTDLLEFDGWQDFSNLGI